jgi:hypothetical protein
MNTIKELTLFFCLLFYPIINFAHAKKINKGPSVPTPTLQRQVNAEVPENLLLDLNAHANAPRPHEELNDLIGLSLSTWEPRQFLSTTYLKEASSFQSPLISGISFSFLSEPFLEWDWAILRPSLEINATRLTRTANLVYQGSSRSDTQTANIFTANIGAELEFNPVFKETVGFFARLSLFPAAAITSYSFIGSDETMYGYGGCLSVGFSTSLNRLFSLKKSPSLQLIIEADGTLGRLDSNNLLGIGEKAGIRLSL